MPAGKFVLEKQDWKGPLEASGPIPDKSYIL